MKQLPITDKTPVLRVDFSNDAAWKKVCDAISKPQGIFRFRANILCISDPEYDGMHFEQLSEALPKIPAWAVIFIVDAQTILHKEHPILVVDLMDGIGKTFRVIPAQMWGVENNLSLANMDFEDFAQAVDPDGVFRDFRDRSG